MDVPRRTSRSGSAKGSGFRNTLSITLTIAVVAPMPSVTAKTMATEAIGVRIARLDA